MSLDLTSARGPSVERVTRSAPLPVSVLGTGALGTAAVRALRTAGHPVVVWNRTPARAAEAQDAGAVLAASVADAVAAAPLTLVCLSDLAPLADLPPAPDPDRTVAVLTTGTPDEVRVTDAVLVARGFGHLAVRVQAGPPELGSDRALLLLAGPEEPAARAVLGTLGRVRQVGADPAAAAVWDLALFGLWYDAQLGVIRALEVAGAAGVDPRALADAAADQLGHVVAGAAATAAEVADGTAPGGPASLREHLPVLRALLDSRRDARLGDGGLAHVVPLVERLVAAGRGEEGLSAVSSG